MIKADFKQIVTLGSLCVCVFLCLWLRIQDTADLPTEQFTETDAYLYYQQAQTIADWGSLPAREMHRWVPVGRDTGQTLNLYAYALAYTYRSMGWLFGELRLYDVVVYAPAICFCLTLAGLSAFLWWVCGRRMAILTAVILATLPATIERSAAGFGDRDAFNLMLGTFAVITYLAGLRTRGVRQPLLWTLVSGFLMLLGGLSWEGFAIFLWVILGIGVWQFLSTSSDKHLQLDAVWVLIFVPLLFIASPAYRDGLGFSSHLFAVFLVPPLVFIGIRGLHVFLIRRSPWAASLKPHAKRLSIALLLGCGAMMGFYLLLAVKSFPALTVSYSQSGLWQSIGELQPPHFGYWLFRYGSVFISGSIGLSVFPLWVWGRNASRLSMSLLAFTALVFFRHPLDTLWGRPSFGDALFVIMLLGCGLELWQVVNKHAATGRGPSDVQIPLAMLFWGLSFLTLARDAKRFDFFIGLPLAFFTALLIVWVSEGINGLLDDRNYTTQGLREKLPQMPLKLGISGVLLLFVMFWGLKDGGYILRTHYAATALRTAFPGRDTSLARALFWMREHLPETAVVAAEWSFGHHLNVLGGVRTITDADHYIPHWIHLYQRHVRAAKNETEALEFLKTHEATHLMITHKQPADTMLQGLLSEAFAPIYPESGFQTAEVKLWELRYPPDIQTHPKYLAIEPGEGSPP